MKTLAPQKVHRSPLRYPGGKQRVASQIAALLDQRLPVGSRIASPFFGGGSVELELASRGHSVTGSDFFKPVAAFWQQLKEDPQRLTVQVMEFCQPPEMTKSIFYQLQSELRQMLDSGSDFDLAWRFYIINRCSFSGASLSGGMGAGDRFTASSVARLEQVSLKNVKVKHGDYWDQLFDRKRRRFRFDAVYADPPYALGCSKLYGNKGSMHSPFNHARFARHMKLLAKSYGVPIVISYNDCDLVRALFAGWNFREVSWAYGMNASKKSNEVLITNF